jgi:hypothetical protein
VKLVRNLKVEKFYRKLDKVVGLARKIQSATSAATSCCGLFMATMASHYDLGLAKGGLLTVNATY